MPLGLDPSSIALGLHWKDIVKIRKPLAAIALLGLAGLGLTACSDDDSQHPQYAQICYDQQTHERVDGSNCESGHSGFGSNFIFWYLLWGHTLPAYGQHVSGGYRTVSRTVIVEHDARVAPRGGTTYTKSTAGKTYTTGATGKKVSPSKVSVAPKSYSGTSTKSGTSSKSGYTSSGSKTYKAPSSSSGGFKSSSSGGFKSSGSSGFKSGGFKR